MKNEQLTTNVRLYSPRATLCAIGIKLRSLKFFDIIAEHVHVRQKTIHHTPIEKLTDAFIAILSGAHGLCEINTRVRTDTALQRAFGRNSCAEQSVVQETLDACTSQNISQMKRAFKALLKAHGRSYRHPYKDKLQLLDVDMTGLPCGRLSEKASKGYFANRPHRYGRQMARVIAAHYEEIIADCVLPGNVQLNRVLRPLLEETEVTLDLDGEKRSRTVLRIDAGGGSLNDVNWLLKRGYQIHSKDCSLQRAAGIAPTVKEWFNDPLHPGRQVGWATCGSHDYEREVRRLIVRWEKKNGQECFAALLSTLSPRQVFDLLGQSPKLLNDRQAVALAYAYLYDKRGGTIEVEIKEDKQGFGLAKRNKKRYEAQQMVVLLSALAHNVVIWSREWLAAESAKVKQAGVLRMVRDVFAVSGFLELDPKNSIRRIVLSYAAAWARRCANSFRALLKEQHVRVILDEI
jgi:Transposase DDE domain group 1